MDRERSWVPMLLLAALLFGCTTSRARGADEAGAADVAGCQDVAGPIPGMPVATFDTDTEQFILDPASGGAYTNLADPDAGTTPLATMTYDGTDGNPTPGSLQIVAPFSSASQEVVAYRFPGCGAAQDWTGKVLRARIKVASGEFAQVALVYVATSTTCTTYDFGYGAFAEMAHTSCWQELSVDLGNPSTKTAGYDPASVTAFGIKFFTVPGGSGGAGPATFLIDSFSVE